MALSVEPSDRLARLLDEHADRLIERWTETVAASLGGRLSKAELTRQRWRGWWTRSASSALPAIPS